MNEKGSITLWLLGAMMTILVVGLFATEVSVAFATRRTVAAVADSAATQAASHVVIDSAGTGEPRIDVERATDAAVDAAHAHPLWSSAMTVEVSATPTEVAVRVATPRQGGPLMNLVGAADQSAIATGRAQPQTSR